MAAAAQRFCLIPDCDRPEEAGGLCAGHRYRKKHGLPLDTPLREMDLSPYERVLEAIREMTSPKYDGPTGEHAWKMRLKAAVDDWRRPRARRSRHRRRKRLPGRRES